VAALSFWAKASKTQNIRYVGFGDANPDKRVIYSGENNGQSISFTTVWKRFIIPIPAGDSGQKTTRAFFFNAQLTKGTYVYIDDIEFIPNDVTLTGMEIADVNDDIFYGAAETEKIFKGIPLKLTYAHSDGTVITLQSSTGNTIPKYNLFRWALPFIEASGNVSVSNGKIITNDNKSHITLRINMHGAASNSISKYIIDGILLDDFENLEKSTIPGSPAGATGYLWHTNGSGSAVITRDYITIANNEIYSGLASGNWHTNATSKTPPRGGRNFEAQNAAAYNTLKFMIRVTGGTAASENYLKGTVFTFELKNGGTLDKKDDGAFFAKEFTYNTDGWQEVKIKLSDFIDAGLDPRAITGYAFSVVDRKDSALRVSLDDIVFVND
jgi:hypothetical protein